MLSSLSQRLLPVLQLTRMALVFTAISNAYCTTLLLWTVMHADSALDPARMLSITGISVGMYGFGMSLNDIIDRRRDRQIASHRPIPSGRLDVLTAHAICTFLGLGAVACSILYAHFSGLWMSPVLVLAAGLLITFYDMAGKYLVAPGLISLGLIRFLHALAPAPAIPVLWHPLLLLTHVTILSTVAYVWEQKRPPLTKIHWWSVLGGLCVIDATVVAMVLERQHLAGLHLTAWLALPRRRGRRLRGIGPVDLAAQPQPARGRPAPDALRPALADRLRCLLRPGLRRLVPGGAHAPLPAGRLFFRATDALVVHRSGNLPDPGVQKSVTALL
jgi:hypothetical protein